MIRFITAVRTVRAEMNVPPSVKAPVLLRDAAPVTHRRAQIWLDAATRLARISVIAAAPAQTPPGSAQLVLDEATLVIPLADLIDIEAERARLTRERARAGDDYAKVIAKLGNADFMARARAEVVDEHQEREHRAKGEIVRLDAALARLS